MIRSVTKKRDKKVAKPVGLLRLDLGCGINKKEGFIGIDKIDFKGVDQIVDLTKSPWPWADESVEEVHASHFVEHLTATERINFVNELYRILIPGGKCTIITPHWSSARAYGDLTHTWPPVCEFWFFYLDKEWRAVNAPHNDFYTCDFETTWGYNIRPDLFARNEEFRNFAMANYKEACQDTLATLTKRVGS